ncbi:MAG: hypothetical protein WCC60_08195 [Ilumatobacteraceae bacterium]
MPANSKQQDPVTLARATALLLLVGVLSGASGARAADVAPSKPVVRRLCTRMVLHGGYVVVPCKPTVFDLITSTGGHRA